MSGHPKKTKTFFLVVEIILERRRDALVSLGKALKSLLPIGLAALCMAVATNWCLNV